MRTARIHGGGDVVVAVAAAVILGCGGGEASTPGAGGMAGGVSAGGVSAGGVSAGGVSAGGVSAGGVSAGGVSAGGVSAGGVSGAGGFPCSVDAGCGGSNGDGGAGGAPPAGATRPIAVPPTYMGSVNNAAACDRQYITSGFEPDDTPGTKHPLFLYFTGTNFFQEEQVFREHAAPAAEAVIEAMARRGFVSLWVEYDNGALAWASDHVNQLNCLFQASNAQNVFAVACALPQVDCDLGIATWGHSQGAYVGHRAANHDARVRAAWLSGYGGDGASVLEKNRLRVVNGQNDTTNGTVPVLNQIAGFSASECPDDGRSECFRDDGSGWVIVRPADCRTSSADHCWFDKVTCTAPVTTLEPNWIDPASTKPFALESNADWVAATARRP